MRKIEAEQTGLVCNWVTKQAFVQPAMRGKFGDEKAKWENKGCEVKGSGLRSLAVMTKLESSLGKVKTELQSCAGRYSS